MLRTKLLAGVCFAGALLSSVGSARADVYPVIVIGKVVMPDGSAPPFTVSIEEECSDFSMTNGPLVDKQGQWVWRINVDLYTQNACIFRAHHDGYTSTTIDASNINTNYLDKTVHVPDLMLMPKVPDAYTIHVSGDNYPAKAKPPFERAMKSIDTGNYEDAVVNLKVAVATAPKFAEGWHGLGVVYLNTGRPELAKDAFGKAVDANPKLLAAYVTLTRTCLLLKDWQCAADTSVRMLRADIKHVYPEIYLHQAVALYHQKNLDAAEQSANEFLHYDGAKRNPRVEYVIGRIREARGDLDGARAHMTRYLALEPKPRDFDLLEGRLELMGKPEAADINVDLELL